MKISRRSIVAGLGTRMVAVDWLNLVIYNPYLESENINLKDVKVIQMPVPKITHKYIPPTIKKNNPIQGRNY